MPKDVRFTVRLKPDERIFLDKEAATAKSSASAVLRETLQSRIAKQQKALAG